MIRRTASIQRNTNETRIKIEIDLNGTGAVAVETGLGFFDHMLTALALHGRFDLSISCDGDLEVDDHHTIEDVAIALGQGLRDALGDKRGIRRFASAYAPLDESLARAVVDLSGRSHATVDLGLCRDSIGPVACENISHFFTSFAMAGAMALHIDVLRGENDHHKAEAAFKALALALRDAVSVGTESDRVPSTKGVL